MLEVAAQVVNNQFSRGLLSIQLCSSFHIYVTRTQWRGFAPHPTCSVVTPQIMTSIHTHPHHMHGVLVINICKCIILLILWIQGNWINECSRGIGNLGRRRKLGMNSSNFFLQKKAQSKQHWQNISLASFNGICSNQKIPKPYLMQFDLLVPPTKN